MGFGLGKDSPVVLSFGRANYEALIERHGQFVRWRTAAKCPCANRQTRQPEPDCLRCGGLGFIYSFQEKTTVTHDVMVADGSGITELPAEYADCRLEKVYGHDGREYGAAKHGQFVTLDPACGLGKGTFLTVVMESKTAGTLRETACRNAGGGYYRAEGLRFRRDGIEGICHDVPADIVKIGRITDAAGLEYEAEELRLDMFRIRPKAAAVGNAAGPETAVTEPVRAENVEYVPPFVFALSSQNLSKEDSQTMSAAKGDAVLTFPYGCDVSEGDILTALSGTHTQKEVVMRTDGDGDTVGAYFVTKIVSCTGRNREYTEGTDFVLAGTNRLLWLCADAPEPGEPYGLTYRLCPTYRVSKGIPQIRTGENQRLPGKAVVEYFGTYGEQRGANRQ